MKSATKKTSPNRPGRPATGITPIRSIRVSNKDWAAWNRCALDRGETVSAMVHRLMAAAIKRAR